MRKLLLLLALILLTQDCFAMQTPIMSGGPFNPSSTVTNYAPLNINSNSGWTTTEANIYQVIPTRGVLANLRISVDTAPGVGKSFTFTIMVNGVASTVSVVLQDANKVVSDLANSVIVVPGDTVDIRCVPSGTPTAPGKVRWGVTFEGGSKKGIILGSSLDDNSTATTEYHTVCAMNTWDQFGDPRRQGIVPTNVTFRNLYVKLTAAPGAGTSFIFTIVKNGVATAIVATVSDTATTASDTTNSVSFVAGDTIMIKRTQTGTPTATQLDGFGIEFNPTIDGETPIIGSTDDTPSASAQRWHSFGGEVFYYSSSIDAYTLAPVKMTIKKLYAQTTTAPGAGNSRIITIDGASGSLSVTLTTGTLGSDLSNTASIAAGDLNSVSWNVTGTPAASNNNSQVSLVAFIPPPTTLY